MFADGDNDLPHLSKPYLGRAFPSNGCLEPLFLAAATTLLTAHMRRSRHVCHLVSRHQEAGAPASLAARHFTAVCQATLIQALAGPVPRVSFYVQFAMLESLPLGLLRGIFRALREEGDVHSELYWLMSDSRSLHQQKVEYEVLRNQH